MHRTTLFTQTCTHACIEIERENQLFGYIALVHSFIFRGEKVIGPIVVKPVAFYTWEARAEC